METAPRERPSLDRSPKRSDGSPDGGEEAIAPDLAETPLQTGAPVVRPRAATSIRTTATIDSEPIAMRSAAGSRSPLASPIPGPRLAHGTKILVPTSAASKPTHAYGTSSGRTPTATSDSVRAPRDGGISSTRAAAAVEACAQASARGRRARVRLRMAVASAHRLPGGVGGDRAARCVGGTRAARARACSRPDGGAYVSGVLAGPRSLAGKRGISLVELRWSAASATERERRPVRLLPRRRLRLGPPGSRRWARSCSR